MIKITAESNKPIICSGDTEEEKFISEWLMYDIQAHVLGTEDWLNKLDTSNVHNPVLSGGNNFLVDFLENEVILYKGLSREKKTYPKNIIRKALLEWKKACESKKKCYKSSF